MALHYYTKIGTGWDFRELEHIEFYQSLLGQGRSEFSPPYQRMWRGQRDANPSEFERSVKTGCCGTVGQTSDYFR